MELRKGFERRTDLSGCNDESTLRVGEQIKRRNSDRDDWILANNVELALWNDSTLRRTDPNQIDVQVKGRVVTLRGHVLGSTNRERAETAARGVPGVTGVRNDLVSDEDLTRDVARALGAIEHKYGVKFYTGVSHGVVKLNGEVPSLEMRILAEECAAEIPGVRGIVNFIRVTGSVLPESDERFLQPGIGKEIYSSDGLAGTVRKVVINPSNRRVVAMILSRRIQNGRPERPVTVDTPAGVEQVVLAVNELRYLSGTTGFLVADHAGVSRFTHFDPADYASPGSDWEAPYPYCRAEVVFPVASPR